jgi:HK97 family phage major capsid protein
LTGAPAGVTDASLDVDYFDLIALEHSIDPAYRSNKAQWMFHDTALATLKQIKAVEDGRPIWLPGLAVNAPDTILGYQYIINQAMPQAEAEAKAILFGDFSYYFIRDVQDIRVLRLEERFAEYLQVGFLAFLRTDGVFASPTAIVGGSEQSANESAPVKYLQFGDESA